MKEYFSLKRMRYVYKRRNRKKAFSLLKTMLFEIQLNSNKKD